MSVHAAGDLLAAVVLVWRGVELSEPWNTDKDDHKSQEPKLGIALPR